VAFEAFQKSANSGAFHQRRAIAYAASACILVGLGIASAKLNSHGAERLPVKEPDPVDVVLEEKIEEEKPKEPEPEPPPPAIELPKHVKISAEPPPPPPKEPDPDTKAKLDESDPSKDKGVAGSHDGSAGGHAGGTGSARPEAPACGAEGQVCCSGTTCNGGLECATAGVCRKPAPPPPPKPAGPAMVSEDDLPAKALSTPPPSYPAAARAAGTQGAVTVRLTIDEQGNVRDAKILKGDPNFDDAVMAVVKSWKYEPAKHQDGKPFLSVKTVKIPFKIKS